LKVLIRPFLEDDLDSLVKNANNPRVAANLTDAFPSPYTLENGKAFLERIMKQDPPEVLGIEVDGQLVGNIGIHPQSDVNRLNAELGYFIGEEHWGKGIMPIAIQLMVDYAFSHFDIIRIFARPFGSNKASQRVLEKSGFTFEARIPQILIKNGRLEDEIIYGIRKKE